jgi:hypothetical protein
MNVVWRDYEKAILNIQCSVLVVLVLLRLSLLPPVALFNSQRMAQILARVAVNAVK